MHIRVNSADEMVALGVRLAGKIAGGEVIELIGDVGTGKTTLTKGLVQGLGVTEEVQSPSFTLNRTYDVPGDMTLVHYDFYRLSEPGILANELADNVGRADTIAVIEWASIVEDVLPAGHIRINIKSTIDDGRVVEVEGVDI